MRDRIRADVFMTTLLVAFAATLLLPVAPAMAQGEESLSEAQRYHLRGTELRNNRKLLDAAEQFQLAIDADPDYVDAYRSLAFVYTEMAKSEADYWQDALDTYESLLDLGPGDKVGIQKNIAFVQASMGEMDDAIDTYHVILEENPEDCSVWTAIGAAQKAEADRARAASDAGAEDPDYQERVTEAVVAFEKVIEFCPDDLAAYDAAGGIHFANGDFAKAAAIYEDLLEHDPENVDVMSKLGFIYKKDENWAKAIPLYEKLLEIDPTRVNDRAVLGKAYEETGETEKAAEQYTMIIESDPSKATMYCNLCFLYVKAKNGQKSVETAMRAISENAPNKGCLTAAWAKGLELRGIDAYRGGLYDNAITAYGEAKLKFTTIQGDKDFGDYATKQITRLNKLIEQAQLQKKKAAQEAGR